MSRSDDHVVSPVLDRSCRQCVSALSCLLYTRKRPTAVGDTKKDEPAMRWPSSSEDCHLPKCVRCFECRPKFGKTVKRPRESYGKAEKGRSIEQRLSIPFSAFLSDSRNLPTLTFLVHFRIRTEKAFNDPATLCHPDVDDQFHFPSFQRHQHDQTPDRWDRRFVLECRRAHDNSP